LARRGDKNSDAGLVAASARWWRNLAFSASDFIFGRLSTVVRDELARQGTGRPLLAAVVGRAHLEALHKVYKAYSARLKELDLGRWDRVRAAYPGAVALPPVDPVLVCIRERLVGVEPAERKQLIEAYRDGATGRLSKRRVTVVATEMLKGFNSLAMSDVVAEFVLRDLRGWARPDSANGSGGDPNGSDTGGGESDGEAPAGTRDAVGERPTRKRRRRNDTAEQTAVLRPPGVRRRRAAPARPGPPARDTAAAAARVTTHKEQLLALRLAARGADFLQYGVMWVRIRGCWESMRGLREVEFARVKRLKADVVAEAQAAKATKRVREGGAVTRSVRRRTASDDGDPPHRDAGNGHSESRGDPERDSGRPPEGDGSI
jgi:hypothetical protein